MAAGRGVMRLRSATWLVGGLAACWPAVAGSAWAAGRPSQPAAAPVKAAVTQVTHPMFIAPVNETDFQIVPPPESVLSPIRQKLDARSRDFEKEFEARNAEEFLKAQAAYRQVQALPQEKQRSPEARTLWARWDAWKAGIRRARADDPEYRRLEEELRAARQSVRKSVEIAFPIITLNNGLIEVRVVPTLGMRVWNAVDLKMDRSLAGSPDPREWEKRPIAANVDWTAGYVEPSFPSFEHGMHVLQPAGWRIVAGPDGTATVAMNMRLTQHQDQRELARYGRFSQRTLSGWVTLRPGESRYTVTYRVDNPLPLRASDRLWVSFLLHADAYDERHIVYPVGYATGHAAAGGIVPVYAPDGERQFNDCSLFAVRGEYDFAGAYSPSRDTNCLIVKDRRSLGLKLYTPGGDGGLMEISTGTNELCEHSGHFRDPYVPTQQTVTCYAVSGIGRVEYASADLAVAARGGVFRLAVPRLAAVEVTDGAGRLLAKGLVGPHGRLEGRFGDRLVVKLDGQPAADVTFPLSHADVTARFADLARLGGKFRMELEEVAGNHGTTPAGQAVAAAERLLAAGRAKSFDAEHAVSLAATAYRLGHLDLASRLTAMVGGGPAIDHIRGLIAWERGREVDFGTAGLDAHYHRAMQAIRKGETKQALRLLDELIVARPAAYRPRLMRAYLARDAKLAAALADEDPGSPEAQLVLELLGAAGAKEARQAKETLLKDNPDAAEQVEAFRREITEGRWQMPRRYEPLLPKQGQ